MTTKNIQKKIEPRTLKGFRDFLPEEARKRQYAVDIIRQTFELYGFEPLETPTLEYAELLLGKYGAEADKLVYTFTDSGDREVGLRYDQTVPTARVLAQYQNQLPKYFRRYQIQNVFRAEKPQKGRYREFTQCDIDIFGTTEPLSDAEIIACTYQAFKNLSFETVKIKINDRAILFDSLIQFATDKVSVLSVIQSIDKLDKMSQDYVVAELIKKGLSDQIAGKIISTINNATISANLKQIVTIASQLGVPQMDILFSPTLARGLDYYTGMIFEVSVPEYGTNSLAGGGRYDKLIGQLGGIDIPAVGIAFGFDRIVEAADKLNLIKLDNLGTQVLVTVFNKSLLASSLTIIEKIRLQNISSEIYVNPEDKLDKQLKYADKKGIPYVIIIGPDEEKNNQVTLKNMTTNEQQTIAVDELAKSIK